MEITQRPEQIQVLLIDDNRDFVSLTSTLLELYGYKAITAYTGMDGIARAQENAPDVIICDIGLPDMDGYSVASALRDCAGHDDRYLISLSGYAQPGDYIKSRQAGFDVHIGKPVDIAELINALQNRN